MTATALDFASFVSGIATTIAEHIPLEAEVAAPRAVRSSMPIETYCLDHEKVIWHFPDDNARMIEDVL